MRHAIKMLGLISVLALSACDGEVNGGEGDVSKFVGTWRATAGTITRTCPGFGSDVQALAGNATWSTGINSDLVSMTALVSCPLMADATAGTASGLQGQNCTQSDGVGATSTVAFTGYTFVLSPDGRTASENASGQITVTAEGAIVVCSFNETGSYQKISN